MKRFCCLLFCCALVGVLSACGCYHAVTDPTFVTEPAASADVPSAEASVEPRLTKAVLRLQRDGGEQTREQQYEYDAQRRLVRVFAPEGGLASRCELSHVWDFLGGEEIPESEERYEYDAQGRPVRVTGWRSEDAGAGGSQSYVIEFQYDDADHVILETLRRDDEEYSLYYDYEDGVLSEIRSSDGGYESLAFNDDGLLTHCFLSLPDGSVSDITVTYAAGDVSVPSDDGFLSPVVSGLIGTHVCDGAETYTEEFCYDASGRLLSRDRVWNESDHRLIAYDYE